MQIFFSELINQTNKAWTEHFLQGNVPLRHTCCANYKTVICVLKEICLQWCKWLGSRSSSDAENPISNASVDHALVLDNFLWRSTFSSFVCPIQAFKRFGIRKVDQGRVHLFQKNSEGLGFFCTRNSGFGSFIIIVGVIGWMNLSSNWIFFLFCKKKSMFDDFHGSREQRRCRENFIEYLRKKYGKKNTWALLKFSTNFSDFFGNLKNSTLWGYVIRPLHH